MREFELGEFPLLVSFFRGRLFFLNAFNHTVFRLNNILPQYNEITIIIKYKM